MGDTGSMLLGTLLAGATITGIGRTTQPQAGDQFALLIPVAIPLLVWRCRSWTPCWPSAAGCARAPAS